MGSPFAALADLKRREILVLLNEGELTAGEIADHFDISKPAISNHLRILQEADLVSQRKVSQHRIFSINRDALKEVSKFLEGLLE